MIIKVKKDNNITIIQPAGRLDVAGAEDFENTTEKLLEEGSDKFLIDCSGLEFLSSSGLRILLILHNKLENISGKMAICCVNKNINDVFNLSLFNKVVHIAVTKEEAEFFLIK